MQTNSQAQQITRRMTPAQKAAAIQERIEAGYAANVAYAAKFRATQAMWHVAHAAGLTPAELHALDMALMGGADPVALLRTITCPHSHVETEFQDDNGSVDMVYFCTDCCRYFASDPATIDPRTAEQRELDDLAEQTLETLADARPY